MNTENIKSYFLAMIAEMGILVINMLNIVFVSRYLGATGAAAYELIFPVMAVISAISCLFYTKADPDVTLSAEERAIGGLGIFMVKKTMDKIEYSYENGFNILTIHKTV